MRARNFMANLKICVTVTMTQCLQLPAIRKRKFLSKFERFLSNSLAIFVKMPKLTKDQRLQLVQIYYGSAQRKAAAALREFTRIRNLPREPCHVTAVRALIKKFERTGSVEDEHRSGRPKVSEEVVAAIRNTVTLIGEGNTYGESSVRAIARATEVPKSTVWKTMTKILKLHPYHLHSVHELLPHDPATRLRFAEDFIARVQDNPQWLGSILWTDEALFTLSGQVNTHNTVIWAANNPHSLIQHPLHSETVNVWIGLNSRFIIGPYFFQEVDGNGELRTVTTNGDRYLEMLENFVLPELHQRNALAETTWMQDGAPAHIYGPVTELLQDEFEDRVISRGFPHSWPPRSPDLTPMDFYFWGRLKSLVYKSRYQTLAELRQAIEHHVASITPDELHRAVHKTADRMRAVIDQGGAHIEHLL